VAGLCPYREKRKKPKKHGKKKKRPKKESLRNR
jgi:hypothetical protein